MQPSLYLQLIEKYYPGLVVSVYNDIITEDDYSHLRDLNFTYSVDGSWESLMTINQNVMADVITMDSSIPLKRAIGFKKATGQVPKVATKRQLNETDLKKLDTLIAIRGNWDTDEAIKMFFGHVRAVILGQLERYEWMYQQSLSNEGLMVTTSNDNVGEGIRVDFQIPNDNKKYASVVWGSAGYTPITDIRNVIEGADSKGKRIGKLKMNLNTFNKIVSSDEAKQMIYQNLDVSAVASPTKAQVESYLLSEYGVVVEIQKKHVTIEIDGVQTTVPAWKDGQIAFLPLGSVGSFVYTELAELNHKSNACNYENAGNNGFILVKKYNLVEPALQEVTASESMGLPVLANVDNIFTLDTTATS